MENLEPLKISDAENAYRAILDLVLKYPNYPASFTADTTNGSWNMTGTTTSIGLFPLRGAVYVKKYISGSYVGLLPFEIVFKTAATTNKDMIKAQEMLRSIGEWLETCGIGFSDTNMVLESMVRDSPVFIASQDEKNTEFAINVTLKYSYKK